MTEQQSLDDLKARVETLEEALRACHAQAELFNQETDPVWVAVDALVRAALEEQPALLVTSLITKGTQA